jgi:hypothetical protein
MKPWNIATRPKTTSVNRQLAALCENTVIIPSYDDDLNDIAVAEQMLLITEQDKRLYIDYIVGQLKPGEFTVMAPANIRAVALLATCTDLNYSKYRKHERD